MSDRSKLAVFETVGEAFGFAWRKFPSLYILFFTATVILLGPIAYLAYPQIMEIFAAALSENEEVFEATMIESGTRLAPLLLLYYLAAFLHMGILGSIITRNILHGENLWMFRINANTFRYLLSIIVVGIILMPAYFILLLTVAGSIIGVSETDVFPGALAALLIVVAVLAFLFVAVRLSLIPVDVVAKSEFSIGSGFRAGARNTLRLFLIYLITVVAVMIVILAIEIVAVVSLAFTVGVSMTPNEAGAPPNPDELASAIQAFIGSPLSYILMVAFSFLQAFMSGIMVGLPAIAYGKLTGSLPINGHD